MKTAVAAREYTFRVAAPEAADEVGVSINQGPWRPCRRAAGYWWFDGSGFAPGEHEVVSRARSQKGRWLVSRPSAFRVS